MGWIRLVEIDGTQTTFREMRYDRESFDLYWKYHRLNCGCETAILSDLKEIPKKAQEAAVKL